MVGFGFDYLSVGQEPTDTRVMRTTREVRVQCKWGFLETAKPVQTFRSVRQHQRRAKHEKRAWSVTSSS